MAGHVTGRKWWIVVSDQEDDNASDEATTKIDHFVSPAREPLTKLPNLSIIGKVTCSPVCILPGEGEVHVSWITLTAAVPGRSAP